ncbi:MAG: winged helix-turn-helix transcriptional regulator [Cocleimonas sp.]|nr:winged helix-turn-helix transcriptional regulator [Cocleimonas sp.]
MPKIISESLSHGVSLFRYQELSLNAKTREVIVDNKEVKLTKIEFNLLFFLISNKQLVLSREALLDEVWGDSYDGYESTLNTHINRLRNKLKRRDNKEDFVKTVWGIGYTFIASDG